MWRRQRAGEGSTDAGAEGPIHREGLRSAEIRRKGGGSMGEPWDGMGELGGGTKPWKKKMEDVRSLQ